MATQKSQQIAENMINQNQQQTNSGLSTSASGISAPAAEGVGRTLGGDASRILGKTEQQVLAGKAGGVDPTLVSQLMGSRQLAQAQKGIAGLGFAQNLGSIRNKIAQQQFQQRQQQAQQGFVGPAGQARQNIQLEQQAENTLGQQESQFTNQLRNLNAQIAQSREQEIQALKPAFGKTIAQEVGRTGLTGEEKGLFKIKSDEGFFGKLGGAFGKDQHGHAELNADALANSTKFQNIATQLGLDINSPDFQNQVSSELKNIVQTEAGSVYDRTTDIKFDDGTGLKTVGESTKSLGKAILDDVMGALTVGGIALIPLTGGASLLADGAAAAGEAAVLAVDAAAEAGGMALGEAIVAEGLELTAAEATSGAISAGIAEGLGESAAEVAGIESGATMNSVTGILESLYGEEALATLTGDAAEVVGNVAAQATSEALAAGKTAEEAAQIGAMAGASEIQAGNLIGEIASGGAEASGAATGAGAAVEQTGASAGAEAAGQTGAEVGAEAAGQTGEGLKKVGKGIAKVTKGVTKPVKLAIKPFSRGAKMVAGKAGTTAQKVITRVGAGAGTIGTGVGGTIGIVESLKAKGLDDATIKKVREVLSEQQQ